jgi:histone deacetylase 1/2
MPAVGGMIMFAATSAEAWTIINHTFAAQSSARSSHIRAQLGRAKKLDSSMSIYYTTIQTLADTLASIGQPLHLEEFTNYILDGLDEEYDSIVELALDRNDPMPAHDLYSRLLSTEQRVESRRSSAHQVHAARYGGKQSRPTYPGPPQRLDGQVGPKPTYAPRPASSCGSALAHVGRFNGARTDGRGDGGTDGRNDTRRMATICQLCDESGHVDARCFKRFNKSFLGMYNDGCFLDRQLSMANHVYGPPGQTTSLPVDPAWYLDTGATDHFAAEMEKLQMREAYQGKEQVHTADGLGMRILHIGQAILPTSSSSPPYLRNVLHAPALTKNLLSAHKLSHDNKVLVEFHPNNVFVKDLDMRAIILRGRWHGVLYTLDAPAVKQVLSALKVSSARWHARLGHPSSQIVQHVLSHNELPSVSNKYTLVGDACQQGKSHQLPFSLSQHVATAPLELIYSDVWGPTQTSVSGHNYYISFVDAYSRFTWLYLIKRKSDVFDVFLQFQSQVE